MPRVAVLAGTLVIIVVLIVAPNGIFGRVKRQKV